MQFDSQFCWSLIAIILTLVVANILLWWKINHTKGCTHKQTTSFHWNNKTLYKCDNCGAILEDNPAVKSENTIND